MAEIQRLKIVIGDFEAPTTGYTVVSFWSSEDSALSQTFSCQILVRGTDPEDLTTKVNDMLTEIRKWNTDITVSLIDSNGTERDIIPELSHSKNTGFLHRPIAIKENHPLNSITTKLYRITVRLHKPASNIGDGNHLSGFVDGVWKVDYDSANRPTVTITARYTAIPTDPVSDPGISVLTAALGHFTGYTLGVLGGDLGFTTANFEVVVPESYRLDDQNKLLTISVVYREVLDSETTLTFNTEALVNVSYNATINTPQVGLGLRFPDRAIVIDKNVALFGDVEYSADVDQQSSDGFGEPDKLRELFLTQVKPFVISRLLKIWALSDKHRSKISRLEESYNPHTNRITVRWRVLIIPKEPSTYGETLQSGALGSGIEEFPIDEAFVVGGATPVFVSYQETIVETLRSNLTMRKLADGKPFTHTNYTVGPTRTLSHIVTALTLGTRMEIPALLEPPWRLLNLSPTIGPDENIIVDVSKGVGADAKLTTETGFRRNVVATYEFSKNEPVDPIPIVRDPRPLLIDAANANFMQPKVFTSGVGQRANNAGVGG